MTEQTQHNDSYQANTYAYDLNSRVARLEAGMDYLRQDVRDMKRELRGDIVTLSDKQEKDFRLLFAMNAATTLGLAGLMAKGFGWLN